jgi:hypothetical protein
MIGGRGEFVPIPSDVTVSSAGIALVPCLLKAGAVAAEADLGQPGRRGKHVSEVCVGAPPLVDRASTTRCSKATTCRGFRSGAGRPSFQSLQHRGAHPGHTIVFFAFDLLHLDGENLEASRYTNDAEGSKASRESGLLLSEPLRRSASQVTEAIRSHGLERVIAKRRNSRYAAGQRNGAWVKLKLDNQQEFVIGGYRPGPNGVDALLVGVFDGSS